MNVHLDCETNLATKEALLTITWDFANVQGCSKIYKLTTNGTIIAINQANCPNFAWGDVFTIKFHREMLVYAPPVVKSTSHMCRLVTGAAIVEGNIGVTDHTSTVAYSADNVSPEAEVVFGQGLDCLTAPSEVIVGDELSMCIDLKSQYRQIAPDYFNIAIRHIVAENLATGTKIALTYEYCNYHFYWKEVSSIAIGQLMGDICPPAGSRKRRSVTNETNYRELELSYNLRVNDEVPEGERHEEPPKSQPQDDFNDYVRIKMAAFYGIIAFFVLALAAAILASCFLFKKAIIAGKKTGFRGKGGHSNPSYHA